MKAWILTDITYPTGGRVHFDYEPHLDPDDGQTVIGGLRIRAIERYDAGASSPAYLSRFQYVQGIYFPGLLTSVGTDYVYKVTPFWAPPILNQGSGGGTSQGYSYSGENGYEPCDAGEMFSSAIIAPMSTSQGNHIGYSVVDVVDENEGSTRYQYNNFVPLNTLSHFYHPFPPASIQVGSGALRNTTVYSSSNTAVSSEAVTFDLDDDQEIITAIKVQNYYNRCGDHIIDDHSLKHTYTLSVSRLRRVMEVATRDGVSTTTHRTFGPDHDFPLEVYGTRSDGSAWRTEMAYPHTYNEGAIYASMRANHQLGSLISNTSYEAPDQDSLLVKTGRVVHHHELINGIPRIHETVVEPAGASPVTYAFAYDSRGRVAESKKEADIPTCFLYDGYHQPVAKISNRTYAQVADLLGSDRTLLESSKNNATIRAILTDLQDALPAMAQMEIYLHEPGLGVIEQIGPTGALTVYEYDGLGRLFKVRDQSSNVIKEYRYSYAN